MGDDFFAFLQSDQSYGRPLVQLCVWLAYICFGGDPLSMHVLGLAFHTLASILLALTYRRPGLNAELSSSPLGCCSS